MRLGRGGGSGGIELFRGGESSSDAKGSSSGAEGLSSDAEGSSSGAEGLSSDAEGSSSGAEGLSSDAEGSSSGGGLAAL